VPISINPGYSGQTFTVQEKQALTAKQEAMAREPETIAVIDHKVMVPVRDGKRMVADISRPKDLSKKYPIIFFRTPYNTDYWDVKLGTYGDMSRELDFVKHGYANLFSADQRVRLERAGANLARSDRNLNTGGNNDDEAASVVAHSSIHHCAQCPRRVTLPVMPARAKTNLQVSTVV